MYKESVSFNSDKPLSIIDFLVYLQLEYVNFRAIFVAWQAFCQLILNMKSAFLLDALENCFNLVFQTPFGLVFRLLRQLSLF